MDKKLKELSFADLEVLRQMLEKEQTFVENEPSILYKEQNLSRVTRNLFAVNHAIAEKKREIFK